MGLNASKHHSTIAPFPRPSNSPRIHTASLSHLPSRPPARNCAARMKKRPTSNQGICYLAGAGPGDLGLVTLKMKEIVEHAEVIVFDYLCNPEILKWAPRDAEIIYAGKKAGQHTLKQDEINALIVEKTRAGKNVV